jgi:hypothetical protein
VDGAAGQRGEASRGAGWRAEARGGEQRRGVAYDVVQVIPIGDTRSCTRVDLDAHLIHEGMRPTARWCKAPVLLGVRIVLPLSYLRASRVDCNPLAVHTHIDGRDMPHPTR